MLICSLIDALGWLDDKELNGKFGRAELHVRESIIIYLKELGILDEYGEWSDMKYPKRILETIEKYT